MDRPGGHGFRFFPAFHKHITDTMSRIPFGVGRANCRDNLMQATRILLARDWVRVEFRTNRGAEI